MMARLIHGASWSLSSWVEQRADLWPLGEIARAEVLAKHLTVVPQTAE
jgi:hypothetical protein